MDEAPNSTPSRRRTRTPRTRLRRDLNIDQVRVEETFLFHNPNNGSSTAPSSATGGSTDGEGCYVTATVNNRRYYGVLIDQDALKSATLLHFQEESSGLDLNRRMVALSQQRHQGALDTSPDAEMDRKRPATSNGGGPIETQGAKRAKIAVPESILSDSARQSSALRGVEPQQVQKFRLVGGHDPATCYRELLATYADASASAEDDDLRRRLIEAACQSGGGFVGNYYFQYEPTCMTLAVPQRQARPESIDIMRMSLGLQTFLRRTPLPDWFPLANLENGQQKLLNIMKMKKDNKGNILWDEKAAQERDALGEIHGVVVPMQPRSCYRVCVVGGGIAGLSSCLEIFRRCERDSIDVEVVLLEGRSRLGGRLWTDKETFKRADGVTGFPVDLGASWIHGIDLNPLAALARQAGVEFVRTSEDVKMLKAGMREVDPDLDHNAGELFDKLLDIAADSSWGEKEIVGDGTNYNQAAVRWYASVLTDQDATKPPPLNDVGGHRKSSDLSVDRAVGTVIANQLFDEFQSLSDDERRMLLWNLKNVEYALGANMNDLSMKFWDIDERHAFDGDHVILRQGYSVVVDHLLKQLQKRGKRFQYHLDYPVTKIEYARKSMTQSYTGSAGGQQLIDVSEACCVTSESGRAFKCDFVVCALPLGVLKASLTGSMINFAPPLPFLKQDAIEAVGFGLLDKIYLQFETAFWRTGDCDIQTGKTLFGNATGINPHHYMFFDIGKTLGDSNDSPAILMSLISGREAVACERLSDEELVQETMVTIRTMFSQLEIPDPIAVRATRWGTDPFSRGSYTFLPPGTTDQDFRALQSPINGNGDSILLEGSETMRLFFAGEHTTSMHPSMAHGALLSGVRAGEEVVSAMNLDFRSDETYDKLIPMAVFRHMNPKAPLGCSFCHLVGGRTYEGPLFAFKRGSRQVLVHNCCAEYTPEVEVEEGQWRYVLKAVNRSASIECCICKVTGASIGCNEANCFKCFHFRCAEMTGWSFEEDGKVFLCDAHRPEGSAVSKRKNGNIDQSIQHALFAHRPASNDAIDASTSQEGLRESLAGKAEDWPRCTETLTSKWCEDAVETRLFRLKRSSVGNRWNLKFQVKPLPKSEKSFLIVESANPDDPVEDLVEGGVVHSLNGRRVGSTELDTMDKVVTFLAKEIDVFLEIECGVDY